MIPLINNRRALAWFCMYTASDIGISRRSKHGYILFTLFVFGFNVAIDILTMHSFFWFIERDSEEAVYVLIQAAGAINMMYIPITGFILRHKITAMLNNLTNIYKKRKISMVFT